MALKAIIIDDEKDAREVLSVILDEYCPDIEAVQQASNLPDGAKLIRETKPDLVFLDIEMPEYSGLQIFDFLSPEEIDFQLIFATAYSEYAVKAFELSAVDYLLKPLRPLQVKQAVERVIERKDGAQEAERVSTLKENLNNQVIRKIGLPVSDGVLFYGLDKISYMTADGMYTKVFIDGEEPVLVSKPMKHFQELLNDHPSFFRPHRSYLINLNFMKQFVRSDGGYILMEDETTVPIARDRKAEFQKVLEMWTV